MNLVKTYCEENKLFFHSWNEEGDEVHEGIDGSKLFSTFEAEMEYEDVQALVYEERERGYGRMDCGHAHDCCGCAFLCGWRVFSTPARHSTLDSSKVTRHFIIKEDWSRNV